MRKGLLALFLSGSFLLGAQELSIIPQPVSFQKGNGFFTISPETHLVLQTEEAVKSAHFLNAYLLNFYGFQLPVAKTGKAVNENSIVLSAKRGKSKQDAYWLKITGKQVNIDAGNGKSLFYGIQSLIQLLPPEKAKTLNIPQVSIVDSSRFA